MADYQQAWKEYRRLRNLNFLLQAILAAICWLVYTVSDGPLRLRIPVFVLLILIIAALVYESGKVNDWPCPRCGKVFARESYNKGFFARRCAHCGLKKYSS